MGQIEIEASTIKDENGSISLSFSIYEDNLLSKSPFTQNVGFSAGESALEMRIFNLKVTKAALVAMIYEFKFPASSRFLHFQCCTQD